LVFVPPARGAFSPPFFITLKKNTIMDKAMIKQELKELRDRQAFAADNPSHPTANLWVVAQQQYVSDLTNNR
jgi:hypothetical protein